jgi:electron transport complex protein RnfB
MKPVIARIDEHACIGCALCLPACPVDAIAGAARRLHTVIAAECIGCRLCLPPCPVDCISLVETGPPLTREARRERATRARRRHAARVARLRRTPAVEASGESPGQGKQDTIERIMQRARDRLRRSSD